MTKWSPKDVEDVRKLTAKIEHDKSQLRPFDIETFIMKEGHLSIDSACRKEWGYGISVTTDEYMSEEQAGKLCQKILDNFNNDNIAKRLRDTIEFLKVESVGGMWNTPQLITMLEDHYKEPMRYVPKMIKENKK